MNKTNFGLREENCVQKVYLKTTGLIWFVHIFITFAFSESAIKHNRDLFNTFIIASVVATVVMLVITIKYIIKGSEDKKVYSWYSMDVLGISALCAEFCVYKFGGYLSKNIPILSLIVFILTFLITGIIYCNKKR